MGTILPFAPRSAIEWPLKRLLPPLKIAFLADEVSVRKIMCFTASEAVWRLFDDGDFSQRKTAAGAILVFTDFRGGKPDIEALANFAEILLAEFNIHLSYPSIFDAERETVLVIGGQRHSLKEFENLLALTRT